MNIWIAGSGDADADKAYKTVLDAYCEETQMWTISSLTYHGAITLQS